MEFILHTGTMWKKSEKNVSLFALQSILQHQWFCSRNCPRVQVASRQNFNCVVSCFISLKPPNFHFSLTNRISYKSLHLQLKFETLLRLKFRPLEVAKVARVQAKKKCWNFQKTSFFELHSRNIPQIKAESNHLSEKQSNVWILYYQIPLYFFLWIKTL